MTPVERVARAIHEEWSLWGPPIREAKPSWADLTADQQGIGLRIARAALASLRKPTEAMVDAARAEMMMDPVRSANVFQVMIDAALNEKPAPDEPFRSFENHDVAWVADETLGLVPDKEASAAMLRDEKPTGG